MKTIVRTSDNSKTVYSEQFGEHYHSSFGAKTESEHIFIEAGLKYISKENNSINILEMGFGTGLNALLTYKYTIENSLNIKYTTFEAYPLKIEEIKLLNYPDLLDIDSESFEKMHISMEQPVIISKEFGFELIINKFQSVNLISNNFDLVYYDAFSPDIQPELWTQEIFNKVYKAMKTGGVLTTYSCKGLVKRNLKASGFSIEKLPGPPGKREFLRAYKV